MVDVGGRKEEVCVGCMGVGEVVEEGVVIGDGVEKEMRGGHGVVGVCGGWCVDDGSGLKGVIVDGIDDRWKGDEVVVGWVCRGVGWG
ncbi:hypothetical protein Tco_0820009 [Tanacetum coccineum]|uniref:Uncharacterized protein n=1 Tax=Tanacetum coccineum TaxID=301880 RepID=A0ABQ5A879_9ASTR